MGAVLESGIVRLVATGASLLEDPQVARLYLGAKSSTRERPATAPDQPVKP
jgi:branched-chain amino acid transport system ATP-binding protein